MYYNVPILFVFFNREEVALKAFERIKYEKPSTLYLACDGPRKDKPDELQIIKRIRNKILSLIDWPCDVHTKFLDSNIGCSLGVSTAISWMFETEEYGIILEDDCVPLPSFFPFMEEMLTKFKYDQRIGHISGFNPIAESIKMPDSYCFSRNKSTWGWATWRRTWDNMDIEMLWRNSPMYDSILYNMGYHGKDVNYWKYRIKAIDENYVSAWDWQFFFSQAANNQLTIYPERNLISNIGFGKDSTHTSYNSHSDRYNAKNDLNFPLTHPSYIVPFDDFDRAFHKYNNTFINRFSQVLPFGLRRIIKRALVKFS